MTTPNDGFTDQQRVEFDALVSHLLATLARSEADPLSKPLAMLAASAVACEIGAASSGYMKGRLAAAAAVLLASIDPRLTIGWSSETTKAH